VDDGLLGELAKFDDPPKGLLAAVLHQAMEDLLAGEKCTLHMCHDAHECAADAAELLLSDDATVIEDIIGFEHGCFAYWTRERLKEMLTTEYQRLALSTAAPTEKWEDSVVIAALGISGEAGEIAEIIKKWKGQGHELNQNKLVEELGDVLWYLTYFCDALGVSLEVVMRKNIEKLRRRYPNGVFETEKSVNRS
jgi:NTP pyrophosphatase (non-canonical NTP hydrolase)